MMAFLMLFEIRCLSNDPFAGSCLFQSVVILASDFLLS